MGGSGKTTLAQYVIKYVEENHLNIKGVNKDENFDLVLWVHVSQNFSFKSIFERIWESSFKRPCPRFLSTEGLHQELRERLKAKRFLLVLDDAWCDKGVTEKQFQQLFAPLQDSKRGSKIVVTTRVEGAAKSLGAKELIELRQLDHDEYLELFMSHALSNLNDEEKHTERNLKVIGKQIAEKLRRSPLAAVTVAAQLRKRLDRDSWLSMLNQNLLKETMGALLLSYQHLPPPLQRCFAFCSLFPKGHKFSEDHLVSLWIGEGFIESEDSNKHVRDVGNEYISELISSSFFQVQKDTWNTLYSVHDLLHDLAEKVSNGECFRIEDGEEREIPTQTRHLYVESFMFEKYLTKICKLKDLRTIIIWDLSYNSGEHARLKMKDLNTLFKGSKELHVVDYYYSSFKGWPECVIYLKNLQYFNYGSVNIKTNRLGFTNVDHINFQKVSSRLYRLRLLRGFLSNNEIPNIGRLTLLQDLHVFVVGNRNLLHGRICASVKRECGIEQLEHLKDIYGEFVIYDLGNVNSNEEACRANLSGKTGLCTLDLCWDIDTPRDNRDGLKDRDADILDELCPPTQIKELTISGYSGKRCPRWFSEYNRNTTHLKKLQLQECPFLEDLPETNNLINLESFTIGNLDRLKWWKSLPPYLVHLNVSGCNSIAFVLEEDLNMIMPTRNREKSPFDNELNKLMDGDFYNSYLEKQQKWESLCQLKEVNGELYLPLTLENLVIESCFIADNILASSLHGHTLLTHLELRDIFPLTFIPREVLRSLTNLQVVKIEYCLMLTSISGLETVSSLEELKVTNCPCLAMEMPVVVGDRKLKRVTFQYCKPSDDMFKALNFLETLDINNCPTIESPDFSDSKSLCSLSLYDCKNLVSLGGLHELTNLETLFVSGCDKLQCASDTRKLPQVKMLTISELSTLQFISRDGLSSLVSLIVERAWQEYFTPEECETLSHLSSVETIEFQYCKMKYLPNLRSLRSLTKLEIYSCEMVNSLSELPTSVQSIRISWCSEEFTRSCEDKNHPNWQKISHVPEKYISRHYYDGVSTNRETSKISDT